MYKKTKTLSLSFKSDEYANNLPIMAIHENIAGSRAFNIAFRKVIALCHAHVTLVYYLVCPLC